MTRILDQRRSLHHQLATQRNRNDELETQMGHMQALANLGLTSAMIAHEMNNVLTPLGTYAQLALSHPEDKQLIQKTLQKTALNARRASKILQSMLAMANGRPQAKASCNVEALVKEIFQCLARDFSKDSITVVLEIERDLAVWADGISLQQVLMNLILNAREAMLEAGGLLTIAAKQFDEFVRIEVRDTGCGIAREHMQKIFEPFFTTKTEESEAPRTGAGLGLAFCKRVIQSHDGAISVDSELGHGTTFRITLPIP
ncbi:MAG: hypothetical protein IH624_05320 [Phycisphaerae bacterium]|nr:hypothetical protein [Phycisphaerae bacterium]